MADTPLCPYLENGQEGQPCWIPLDPDDGSEYCPKHSQPRYSVCVGCASLATRLCQECPSVSLAGALCPSCRHLGPQGDRGLHGPVTEHETPRSVGEPESGGRPSTIEGLRAEMIETVLLSNRSAEQAGLSDWDRAAKVVADLATSTLYGLVHTLGLAIAQEESG